MSKTYGRIGGDCWEEAYQKAEEVRVLQRYRGNRRFVLTSIKQYLVVGTYQTGMVLKKIESISKRLEPTSALHTVVIGSYIVPLISALLGSTFVGTGLNIGFGTLFSIIASNWVLVLHYPILLLPTLPIKKTIHLA